MNWRDMKKKNCTRVIQCQAYFSISSLAGRNTGVDSSSYPVLLGTGPIQISLQRKI